MDNARDRHIMLEVNSMMHMYLDGLDIGPFAEWAFGENKNGMMKDWNHLHGSELKLEPKMMVYETLPKMVEMYKQWLEQQGDAPDEGDN